MLLDFRVSNFKSFADEADFSMVAAPKQKGLNYSVHVIPEKRRRIKVLCSSVIYGPNASGKTNIIEAIDVLRSIIMNGNIRNPQERNNMDPMAASRLELIPNSSFTTPQPVEFSITFYERNMRFIYDLSMDIGCFLDVDYNRRILTERLSVNGEQVFYRDDSLDITCPDCIRSYIKDDIQLDDSRLMSIAANSLAPDELFLTNGFRLIYASQLVGIITNWFADRLKVFCHGDLIRTSKRLKDRSTSTVHIDQTINRAARLFGGDANDIGYVANEDGDDSTLCSLVDTHNKKNIALPADIFESYGTVRFVNLFPLLARTILTGGTLIVDEFDASIHPMALMSIINIFHNNEINIHHAQLIFNTHNPIFLNSNLFRRDEIKFVERDDDTHNSTVYSLSDFGTSGSGSARKDMDYMKGYFINRYGAIKDIDFTPIFEELVNHKEGGHETN